MKKETYKLNIATRPHTAFGETKSRVQVQVNEDWHILDYEVDQLFKDLGLLKNLSKKTLVISNDKKTLKQDVKILTLIKHAEYDNNYEVDNYGHIIFICELLLKFFKEYPDKMYVQLI